MRSPAERTADVAARDIQKERYHRVLRVALTLADLDATDGATRVHVAEALAYRRIVPGRNALLVGA